MSQFLRRFADALESGPNRRGRRRSVLDAAAADFLSQLRARTGTQGGAGYAGGDLSRMAAPAFWTMLLLSSRRQRLAMHLLAQEYPDAAAVRPYAQEKNAALEVLSAIPGIDADSLIGFVDVAIDQYRPDDRPGDPLIPRADALQILRAALLRGAMVGELRPEGVPTAWIAAHAAQATDPERHWRTGQAHAEDVYAKWREKRGGRRRLI